MRIRTIGVLVLLVLACGCTSRRRGEESRMSEQPMAWPKDWSVLVGRRVTVEGTALDAKLGAVLSGDGPQVWIDGLDAWPEGYYKGGREGRRVRVTGTVIARDDVPVVEPTAGGPQSAGVPGGPAQRFLLHDSNRTPVE